MVFIGIDPGNTGAIAAIDEKSNLKGNKGNEGCKKDVRRMQTDMTLNEYQDRAAKTAVYPKEVAIEYLILGLVSEAGEVAGIHKKQLRDGASADIAEKMIYEIGDCFWYIAMLAEELGVPLQSIAEHNLKKLSSRKERGVIGGSGDKR